MAAWSRAVIGSRPQAVRAKYGLTHGRGGVVGRRPRVEAAGRLGAAIMLSNLPWDVSAGVLLVREAGGLVLDLDGTQHTPGSRCMLACTHSLQQPLLDLIATVPEAAAFGS